MAMHMRSSVIAVVVVALFGQPAAATNIAKAVWLPEVTSMLKIVLIISLS